MEPPFYIIRWSVSFAQPDGTVSNMLCHKGPREVAEEYADRMAKKHEVKVEAIV